jgi:serine phosphatase RsbU (regulator of sigma subunit)
LLVPGDLVILATDGVVDNFDPVLRKEALLEGGKLQQQPAAANKGLPVINYEQAHDATGEVW